jgi:hypothetical protein
VVNDVLGEPEDESKREGEEEPSGPPALGAGEGGDSQINLRNFTFEEGKGMTEGCDNRSLGKLCGP